MRDVELVFEPMGDTQSTLEALNDTNGYFAGDMLVETGYFSAPVNPSRYKLTTKAGYQYYLDQSAGIEKVVDPNGHTLTYTKNGIYHSSGKSVPFERNSQGHITAVVAPNGSRLLYAYDDKRDLVSVTDRDLALGVEARAAEVADRLVDRVGNVDRVQLAAAVHARQLLGVAPENCVPPSLQPSNRTSVLPSSTKSISHCEKVCCRTEAMHSATNFPLL